MQQAKIPTPAAPMVLSDDGSGEHQHAIMAVGVQGHRTAASSMTQARGRAKLRWDSVNAADAYLMIRDGSEITGRLRIKASQKEWTAKGDR